MESVRVDNTILSGMQGYLIRRKRHIFNPRRQREAIQVQGTDISVAGRTDGLGCGSSAREKEEMVREGWIIFFADLRVAPHWVMPPFWRLRSLSPGSNSN